MKVCSKCSIKKDFIFFNRRKISNDGFRSECKDCRKKQYLNNKDNIKIINKNYYEKNKSILLKNMKEYQNINKLDGKIINNKKLRESLKENESLCTKCLEIKNITFFGKDNSRPNKINPHCNECRNIFFKNSKEIDPVYKLICNIRSYISYIYKNFNIKKTEKTITILGCTPIEFKMYIESKLKEDMNFENYGEWHLDHIIPISHAENEHDVYRLNHYTNFQPLWAFDNLSKGNRYIG